MAGKVKRRGWTRRKDDYRLDEDFPSYELRLARSFWPTVHSTPRPRLIWSPMGTLIGQENGYDNVAEAMEDGERLYREALSNRRATAQRTEAEMADALDQLNALETPDAKG